MEADLLRYYGVDLLDYHRGTLSSRRLRVLVQHLPETSALVRALHGDSARWGLAEHLLAVVADHVAVGNWLFASAHTPDDAEQPTRPEPLPRPGIADAASDTPSASPEEIAAFFATPHSRPSPPSRGR